MKFIVGNLHTGRIGQTTLRRHLQLRSALPKRLQRYLKGPKLKTESDYQVRSISALKETEFSSLRGPLTICVSKRHSFSFHIR